MIRKTAVIFLFHSQEKMTNDLTRKKKKIRGERDGIFCSLFEPVATVDSLPFFFSSFYFSFSFIFLFLSGPGVSTSSYGVGCLVHLIQF